MNVTAKYNLIEQFWAAGHRAFKSTKPQQWWVQPYPQWRSPLGCVTQLTARAVQHASVCGFARPSARCVHAPPAASPTLRYARLPGEVWMLDARPGPAKWSTQGPHATPTLHHNGRMEHVESNAKRQPHAKASCTDCSKLLAWRWLSCAASIVDAETSCAHQKICKPWHRVANAGKPRLGKPCGRSLWPHHPHAAASSPAQREEERAMAERSWKDGVACVHARVSNLEASHLRSINV